MIGRGGAYVPTGNSSVAGTEGFVGNVLTSDPVRYVRNAAIMEHEPALGLGAPTVAWADAAMRQMNQFAEHSYSASIRQPILMVAAGAVMRSFQLRRSETWAELAGRASSHPGRRQTRDTTGTGPVSRPILAAFDAFVPGTPRF